MKFAGYTKVYEVAETDDAKAEAAESADKLLPPLEVGDAITLESVRPEQHFTQPPPRFSEASLVKELEERGIGRPSTYASIMSTIVDRGYVEKKEARFWPTELGILVNGLLVESFPEIVSSDFTADMESKLDKVEEGSSRLAQACLGAFYEPFKIELRDREDRDARRRSARRSATEWVCEKCGKPMWSSKWGRNGQLPRVPGLPRSAATSMEVVKNLDGTWEKVPPQTTDEVCETCGKPMTIKRGKFGSFLACTGYPDCKTTKPISLGVKCPRPGCGGFIAEEAVASRQVPFYGCSELERSEAVRLRRVGQAGPAAVPGVQREVRPAARRTRAASTLRCAWTATRKQGVDETGESAAA